MQHNILLFHGIKFHNYSYSKILFKLNQVRGGYLVAPAASSLSKIYKDKFHYEALKKWEASNNSTECSTFEVVGIRTDSRIVSPFFAKYYGRATSGRPCYIDVSN